MFKSSGLERMYIMNKIYSQDTHVNIIVVVLFVIGLFMIWFRGDIIQGFKNEEIIIDSISNTLDQTTLDQTTVEAGQIWVSKTDNPFNKDIYLYIVEIKADYVGFTSVKFT